MTEFRMSFFWVEIHVDPEQLCSVTHLTTICGVLLAVVSNDGDNKMFPFMSDKHKAKILLLAISLFVLGDYC